MNFCTLHRNATLYSDVDRLEYTEVKQMVSGHPFVKVVRTPGVARILFFWLLAFMPAGMNSVASVLTLRENHYSYADAGTVVGAYLVGMAVMSPFVGRLMDRIGLARVLVPCAVGYASGVAVLVVLASRHAPLVALCAASSITGVVLPRVTSALRARWPSVMPSVELRDQAYLVDATLGEAVPIVGAVLVAVLATTTRPAAALLTSAGFALVGTVGFVMSPAARRHTVPAGSRSQRRPLSIAGIRALILASAAMAVPWGQSRSRRPPSPRPTVRGRSPAWPCPRAGSARCWAGSSWRPASTASRCQHATGELWLSSSPPVASRCWRIPISR
jgi:MFS family permease